MKVCDRDPSGLMTAERDACAIICYVDKSGRASHGNVQRTIEALVKMGHRAGEINGEGDGCGILTDIPRKIWNEVLSCEGHPPGIAFEAGFAVGHFMIGKPLLSQHPELQGSILNRFHEAGLEVLAQRPAPVRSEVLAAAARLSEPLVWQVALRCPAPKEAFRTLYRLQVELEQEFPIHIASLSCDVAAYKVHGAPEILSRYYPELKRREFLSSATIGHSRYSTNTLPTVLRAQPFSLLGHNGEINTIARLREESRMLGIVLPLEGSDSQDLNRILEGLTALFGLNLFEAMEMVFPPIFSAMDRMEPELLSLYRWFRHFLTASAQGPAAIIARNGDRCVFSVDAMGLRPLWIGETDQEIFASSELGVVPHEEIMSDPKPLAPGEKIGLQLVQGERPRLTEHHALRREVYETFRHRTAVAAHTKALQTVSPKRATRPSALPKSWARTNKLVRENLLSALAWKSTDVQNLKEMARTGDDPITSLGYDGPLAALSLSRQNLSDYFKEQVAVVTNPAIDRERESEHFSTRVFLGARPSLKRASETALELPLPLLLGGSRFLTDGSEVDRAEALGAFSLEEVLARFGKKGMAVSCSIKRGESLQQALDRLVDETVVAVCSGIQLILLDDADVFTRENDFLDPFLLVAVLHKALKETTEVGGESLRRRASLVIRSGALRNLHDLIFALGMGGDALCPYLIWEQAGDESDGVANAFGVLARGLEKVISTMGTHEIGGYGKYFASIGLSRHLAEIFETPNFCGSEEQGLTLQALEADNRSRAAVARRREEEPIPVQFRLYPRIWKMVGQVAKMEESYADLSKLIQQFEVDNPLAIRHLIDLRYPEELSVDPEEVDTTVGGHDLPILFSAMSFGSQGETPFRIYAEAARRLNIICMNGEGGRSPTCSGATGKTAGSRSPPAVSGSRWPFSTRPTCWRSRWDREPSLGRGGTFPDSRSPARSPGPAMPRRGCR